MVDDVRKDMSSKRGRGTRQFCSFSFSAQIRDEYIFTIWYFSISYFPFGSDIVIASCIDEWNRHISPQWQRRAIDWDYFFFFHFSGIIKYISIMSYEFFYSRWRKRVLTVIILFIIIIIIIVMEMEAFCEYESLRRRQRKLLWQLQMQFNLMMMHRIPNCLVRNGAPSRAHIHTLRCAIE